MLVLSRRPGEAIQIGDDVKVHVLKLPNGRVQLGIEAPRDVRVLRTELSNHDETGNRQDAA